MLTTRTYKKIVQKSFLTILVFDLIAALTFSGCVQSTKDISMPNLDATFLKYLLVPP